MSVEYAIKNLVLADTAIAALIATRYYPLPLPANKVYPLIGYMQINDESASSHQGSSHFAITRLQLSPYADTHKQASDLRSELKRLLIDYRGSVVTSEFTYRIDRIQWLDDRSRYDTDTQKNVRDIDLRIQHSTLY